MPSEPTAASTDSEAGGASAPVGGSQTLRKSPGEVSDHDGSDACARTSGKSEVGPEGNNGRASDPNPATVEIAVSDETRRRLRWIAERLDCTEPTALEVVLDNWFGGSDVKT